MPDEKKQGEFTYGVNEKGQLLMDGIVIESNLNTYGGDTTSEVPVEDVTDRTNAAVEGEEAEPKKAPEPEPVKAPEPPPEPPKIPEKQKYQLKIRGEMQEKEYSKDEIVARLQMAESYGIRNDELREKHKKIEPFLHVFERPDFKEWLESKVAVGDITAPAETIQPSNADVIRYRLRAQEPEFQEIRNQMSEWAATLPDQEADILNSDHKAFVDAYDHFKNMRKAPVAAPPPSAPVLIPKKEVEKAIANKEVIKQQARVEPPGGATPLEEEDPKRAWEKEDRRLQKAVRSGERSVTYLGRRMDPEDAWVMHRFQKGT